MELNTNKNDFNKNTGSFLFVIIHAHTTQNKAKKNKTRGIKIKLINYFAISLVCACETSTESVRALKNRIDTENRETQKTHETKTNPYIINAIVPISTVCLSFLFLCVFVKA